MAWLSIHYISSSHLPMSFHADWMDRILEQTFLFLLSCWTLWSDMSLWITFNSLSHIFTTHITRSSWFGSWRSIWRSISVPWSKAISTLEIEMISRSTDCTLPPSSTLKIRMRLTYDMSLLPTVHTMNILIDRTVTRMRHHGTILQVRERERKWTSGRWRREEQWMHWGGRLEEWHLRVEWPCWKQLEKMRVREEYILSTDISRTILYLMLSRSTLNTWF